MKTKLLCFILVLMFCSSKVCFALDDDLKKAVEVAAHGSHFQSERLKVAAENMANEDSTAVTPGGNPYRRKVIFANNNYDKRLRTNVVTTKKVDFDNIKQILEHKGKYPVKCAAGYDYHNLKTIKF